ncbi:MAG: hypothetical protein U5K79_13450 [Cyclobacteriaceae bacterium]|nr:hypothetical protein [Cyclobacteriaceae bacterium]
MVTRAIFLSGILLLLVEHPNAAQIYAQGHNINNMSIYTLSVVLVKQPNGSFLASLDFRGRRKDVVWYIKEGVAHKAFTNTDDLMGYMSKNGWIFTERQDILSTSGQFLGDKYMFRKSMEQISAEENQKKL